MSKTKASKTSKTTKAGKSGKTKGAQQATATAALPAKAEPLPDAFQSKDGSKMLPIGKDAEGNDLYLAEDPITWRQYLKFCEESGYPKPAIPSFFGDLEILSGAYLDHPVVNVSFIDAMNYCAFYGLDLPTEEEWLQAAKHPDGAYPWGKDEPSKEHLNCAEFGPGKTTPVGNYPKGNGRFGHRDLAGNVWEWCRNKEDKPQDFVDPKGNAPASASPSTP